jgi:hypothetical protein
VFLKKELLTAQMLQTIRHMMTERG